MAAEKRGGVGGFAVVWVVVVAIALGGLLTATLPRAEEAPDQPARSAASDPVPRPEGLANDLRVRAFLAAYGEFVDTMTFTEDDAAFVIGGEPIFFQDGRMLAEDRLSEADHFDPIFYEYSLAPLTEPLPLSGDPVYSRDLLERLFGRTEPEIRSHGQSATFLGRKVFVNEFCLDALHEVEADIRRVAREEKEVADWVSAINVAYSFINRDITGSESRSYHSWGLAIDLVPTSFRGRPVYWRWSRVLDPDGWYRIPPKDRWSPPQAVIEAFEAHGFVWGGKWSHFDAMHFEYRPEVILFNRMASQGAS